MGVLIASCIVDSTWFVPPPSREKIWREKLFLRLVQNESKANRLISICTKPRKKFSRQILSLDKPSALMVGVILFKKICTRPPCRQGPVPAGAGKAPPARSATETDRAASRPSHRAVAAGKQRRGRASRALRIPADDAAFPCVISIRFQSFLNFVLDQQ